MIKLFKKYAGDESQIAKCQRDAQENLASFVEFQ